MRGVNFERRKKHEICNELKQNRRLVKRLKCYARPTLGCFVKMLRPLLVNLRTGATVLVTLGAEPNFNICFQIINRFVLRFH